MQPIPFTGVLTHMKRETFRFIKVINQTLFPPIISSLLYIIVFHFVVGKSDSAYITFLVPGLVMMSVINNAFANSSSSLFISKWTTNFQHLLTMPLSYFELCVGYVFGSVMRGLLTGAGIIVVLSFFVSLPFYNLWIVFLYFLITTVLFGSLGVLVALWADHFEHMGIFNTFFLTPLTMLGGVFYSISVLPPVFQTLSLFNPIFYLVDGFRYGLIGVHDAPILFGLGVSGVISLSSFVLIVYLMGIGYKVKE